MTKKDQWCFSTEEMKSLLIGFLQRAGQLPDDCSGFDVRLVATGPDAYTIEATKRSLVPVANEPQGGMGQVLGRINR